ncbi:copper chaperone PCu(A)C [Pseudidiomarina terrestris]|uniref:Copper chaperone PCu(A)C n=1 Tax=Pseudidiomarina terrestris TaxID=2820060 RepID=A0AAW7R2D8_9GAMM|nr:MULTISPECIES: copper chaperone PCu(A)C [unclassified Pseudidiomarina]MDN7125283.1 copper chaperone PCu(A)C [Pseudidiomarina sp. 1APP75-32.1]MDN7127316.1 copper chaperone PCu(A)C [Pseudidiomarina sp. 1APR75-33.1]MDN7130042.1 copper chaperone PCu(A)C [Pseudidiomarina sp. 1APR75-15]MDN7136194.1 copper chaperone PCu(A)C [Pseudidiomarina sp. 1ASP75-5]MDN7138280.1 copper chaperone PCu(A)C [Pseudidiomarina sp. 1ASP75-14]
MKQLVVCLALLLSSISAQAEQLSIDDAWVKPTIPGTENGAGYVVITNTSETSITLIGVTTEAARAAEVHQHIMSEDGMMRMRRVPELVIGPKETVTFQPGGYHVMFFGVKFPFKVGDEVAFQLQFADADALEVNAEVRPL